MERVSVGCLDTAGDQSGNKYVLGGGLEYGLTTLEEAC